MLPPKYIQLLLKMKEGMDIDLITTVFALFPSNIGNLNVFH